MIMFSDPRIMAIQASPPGPASCCLLWFEGACACLRELAPARRHPEGLPPRSPLPSFLPPAASRTLDMPRFLTRPPLNRLALRPLQEHAYYGSFGYHVTNFFGVSSRCGTPDELKAMIDEAHRWGRWPLLRSKRTSARCCLSSELGCSLCGRWASRAWLLGK